MSHEKIRQKVREIKFAELGQLLNLYQYLNPDDPVQLLANFSVRFPKGIVGFQNFTQMMDTEPEIKDRENAVEVCSLRGDIRYEDITFGYDSNRHVLENVSLSVKAGETVAFVGTSGAGKTTLCSLLPRFYEAESGKIAGGRCGQRPVSGA